jgi:hypothetical protein
VLAVDREDDWPDGVQPYARMVALAATLRNVLVSARSARPDDLIRPGEKATRVVDAIGVAPSLQRLETLADTLDATSAELTTLADQLGTGQANAVQVRTVLEKLAAYGVVVPIVKDEQLGAVARLAAGEAKRRADEAAALVTAETDAVRRLEKLAGTLFGDGFFVVLPLSQGGATPDRFAAAVQLGQPQPAPTQPQIRRFLRDLGFVRKATGEYCESLLVGDALGRPTAHTVVQIGPGRPNGPDEWIGGVMDTSAFTPSGSVAGLVFEGALNLTSPVQAIVVDEWVDTVPVGAASKPEIELKSTPVRASGLALNARAASASAPQALLIAISPDGRRWTTDKLVGTLDETLALAKLRAVTLEQTGGTGSVLPAIYTRSASLQGYSILDLAQTFAFADTSAIVKYVKEP